MYISEHFHIHIKDFDEVTLLSARQVASEGKGVLIQIL